MTHSQKVETLPLADLVLWTENPRDPIDPRSSDQDVANRAIDDDARKKWSLNKLFEKMGSQYDFSELPTVVMMQGKPVVFDGNRRILIGKIIHGHVAGFDNSYFQGLDFPTDIPCNVCSKSVALENILRKHSDTGSWAPLERDIFLHKHMGQDRSIFLIFEEASGLVSSVQEMNQRFVKEEVLTQENMNALGFFFTKTQMRTIHSEPIAEKILQAIVQAVESKQITTRISRGNILGVLRLDATVATHIRRDWTNSSRSRNQFKKDVKPTPFSKIHEHEFLNQLVKLQAGEINNLYRDIRKMASGKSKFSPSFPILLRMSLRMLYERASQDAGYPKQRHQDYCDDHFDEAKNLLSADEKTTLSTQNVTKSSLPKLLQIGAHGYTAVNNYEQALAMSIILGKMLKITHEEI